MKSRTSFFNTSVLRKDLTRFAPVWVLYGVLWFLIVYLSIGHLAEQTHRARIWTEMFSPLAVFNLLYAGLTGALLLGDLFNPRMCNALHAMPLRREGWLLTHSAAGFLFSLIPYALATLLLAVLMPDYIFVALLWFACAMLQYLFFFGLAVFAGMCAGSRLGMAAVYFILNFFFLLVYALYYLLYEPLLHGIVLDMGADIIPFIPMAQMGDSWFINYYTKDMVWKIISGDWYYLFLCLGIGVAAWALSFLLYRKRNLECAGDFVAFRPVAPIFLAFYTLGVGAVLYLLPEMFAVSNSYAFLVVGILIGYFTGRMFLEKTVRVFRPKAFVGLVILAAVVTSTMVVTWLDPLGVTYYMPDTEEVTGMRLYSEDDIFMYRQDITDHMFTDAGDMENLRSLHTQMIQDRGTKHPDLTTCDVVVEYCLADGSTRKRYYSVDPDSKLGQQLELHLSDARSVLFTNDFEDFVSRIDNARVYSYNNDVTQIVGLPWDDQGDYAFTQEQIPELMAAIKADCDAGYMAQDWAYQEDRDFYFWLYLEIKSASGSRNGTEVRITKDCINTLAYFETIGE